MSVFFSLSFRPNRFIAIDSYLLHLLCPTRIDVYTVAIHIKIRRIQAYTGRTVIKFNSLPIFLPIVFASVMSFYINVTHRLSFNIHYVS